MTQKVPARKTSRKAARSSVKKAPRARKSAAASKRGAKKMASRDRELVLAYDLGGTKVACGAVDRQGSVITEIREPVVLEKGKEAVLEQLARLGKDLMARHPSIRRAGMASAGPLDPMAGVLLDPTNFASSAGTWGRVPIADILTRKLGIPVFLENDAAAAMLAEHWVGAAQPFRNAMILTLGTGLGTGIISNGALVRAGRHLHPEAGHIILNMGDESAPCGCGNLGCAEAYLSGRSFARRARVRFGDASLTGKDITEMARRHDPRALAAFEEYAHHMAVAIHNYVVLYCPEIVVFTGSFAEAANLFMDNTLRHLERLLVRRRVGTDLMPKLAVSSLQNQAGIIGGAYVAFNR
jgi:glucokinase